MDQIITPPGLMPGTNKKIKLRNSRITLPNRLNIRSVMASPPTITSGSSASLASPFFCPAASDSSFYNLGGVPSTFFTYMRGAPYGQGGSSVPFGNVTIGVAPTYGGISFGVAFFHDGQALEIIVAGNSNFFLIKVDDQYVGLTPVSTGASGTLYYKMDFGAVKKRRIDLIGSNLAFVGVNIGQNDSLSPAPIRGPRCIVLGDSFPAGSGATGSASNSFPAVLSDLLGWDDVWASGVPGSGYLNTNGGTVPKFRDRLAHDVFAYNPEVVWIVGSVNDDGLSPSALLTEATLLYQTLRGGLPNATIIASPTASKGVNTWSSNKLQCKDSLKQAALACGVVWVDPLEAPISVVTLASLSGTIYAPSTVGATTINVTGTSAKSGYPQPAGTFEIGSGATRERIQVKTSVFGGSYNSGNNYYWAVTFDGAMQYAHAAGETWVQVGPAYLTGRGRIGSTTGFGNADLLTSTDAVHPGDAGHVALATELATLFMSAFAPN